MFLRIYKSNQLLESISKVNIKEQIGESSNELANRKSLPRCSQHVSRNPY